MKKSVLIALIIFVLVSVIVGMGLMLAGILPLGKVAEQTEGQPELTTQGSPLPPIYIRLDPAFTVSFADDEEAQFLQLDLSATTTDTEVEEAIGQHMPAIRNALIMLFSSQKAADLTSRAGKEKLRQEALGEIRRVLEGSAGKAAVDNVYFTSFMMQ